MKASVSNTRIIFWPCAVQKLTVYVDIKALSMRHQSQNGFWVTFVKILQHQKRYLIYVPSTRKTVSSYNIVFDKRFSIMLAYMSF